MARTETTVSSYIAAQPKAAQPALRRVRSAIRKALPGAEETISYKIPTYKVGGKAALFFAGWKEHYSLYPVGDALMLAMGREIGPYKVAKGTLRFPLAEPVQTKLIERIARLRAKEVTTPRTAKAKKKL
jgi:uncharacterized protein YdhG (YjbR/CyaY superfamily)